MQTDSNSFVKELESQEPSFRPLKFSLKDEKPTEVAELESKEIQFRNEKKEGYKNLGRAVQFSLSFLVLFSAWNTC